MRNAATSKVRRQRKSEKISPLLSTPRSLCKKTKQSKFMQSLRQRKDFRVVIHTQRRKDFLWKNMMRSLENRKRSSVSVCPELQCELHLLTDGGEQALKQFDCREVITFFPISLPHSLPVSLSLSVAHTDQTRHEYQSAALKTSSCHCRCTVWANGETHLTTEGW